MEHTLIKPHTHGGVALPAGAKVTLTEPEREWALANGVIAPVEAAPAEATRPAKAARVKNPAQASRAAK